ncbi:4-hydroxy-tetrahydrodipicolinate reductase [Methylacidimicrobium cyclopophantes]|uniref:4-hydroxy-tetrahydrodipicolinate reductase n=1 Tax=Methylacidimicrobium cyclopophantes TaxID=1041766 RepID=A0A5E6MHJ1_9BACT|nr:4-hydroxy-tetrahydrodipicolinate reductase [Methylacidimicrobium cyclopophantes]VVM07773.1 4-hydroxy-tetrahydrodipicolinate reductase [Methylacidimicrobium cyclopophantes]
MIRLAVTGAKGRMGRAVLAQARRLGEWEVAGAIDQGDALEPALLRSDVAIDFSSHAFSTVVAEASAAAGKPLVIGTTGHLPEELLRVRRAAERIPIVRAPNFSTGVNLLFYLVRKAAAVLGEGFDPEIVEAHHREKRDAPSGTARRLAEIVAEVRGISLEKAARYGREGEPGPRKAEEIGIHAIRAGQIVGLHTVLFAGSGEVLELTHRAETRDTFALGSLRAARWVVGKPPGMYSMEDVLGLVERE